MRAALQRRVAIGGSVAAAVVAALAGGAALERRRAAADVEAVTVAADPAKDLVALLGSQDFKERAQGLRRLGELGPEERAAVVGALARDPRAEVRLLAISALGKLEDRAAARTLLARLCAGDPDPDVRDAAGQLFREPQGAR